MIIVGHRENYGQPRGRDTTAQIKGVKPMWVAVYKQVELKSHIKCQWWEVVQAIRHYEMKLQVTNNR